ncbi:glycosyltransferase, partial [bacterium]|nr:glycosyltransferase [bacterium]
GIDGVMVEQDASLLAEKLTWFLDHPEEAEKMGQAGFERVQNEYSWEVIVSQVEEFFKKLTTGK